MSTFLHWVTLAAYLGGGGLSLAFLLWQRRGLYAMGRGVLWLGFSLHTLALIAAWVQAGVLPAVNLRQSLDFLSWALMGAGLVVNLRLNIMILGALTAPLCIILLLAASVLPPPSGPTPEIFKSLWLVAHVISLLTGYGLLALNCLGSLLYLLQDSLIRAKRLGATFRRLPSLGRLDQLNQQALLAGFVLLTIGILTGAAYAQAALGSYWRWDPKETWGLISWLCYAALLHIRLVQGWRGRKGSWLALAAFAALLFTFLGAGLLLPGYHSFDALGGAGGPRP